MRKGVWLTAALHFLFRVIDRAAIRSLVSLLIHICVAVALAALFYFGKFVGQAISDDNLVAILAGIAAISGAFLALTVALGTFQSQLQTDWAYRNYERLRNQREKIEDVMRKSAGKYPDISGYLRDSYFFMASYFPGQTISRKALNKMAKSDIEFRNWVDEQVKKSGKEKVDFGNVDDYESFLKHAMDAMFIADESREILGEIVMGGLHGRSIGTLTPLIMTWAFVLVFSLIFAVTGSLDVMGDSINLSILVLPIYLCFFSVSAIVIDFRALTIFVRMREMGWEEGSRGSRGERLKHWSEKYK